MGSVERDPTGFRVPARTKLDDRLEEEAMGRKHFEEWIILSNGPSISGLGDLLQPGDVPVVAVNHAIWHETIRADVWSVNENHSALWEQLILNAKAKGPVHGLLGETWVAQGHYKHWMGWIRAQRSHRRLPELDVVPHPNRTRDWQYRGLPWKPSQVAWGERTIFATVAHAFLRGAKRITCYGVDMEGASNFGGGVCTEEERRVHHNTKWEERWDEERRLWDLMVSEAENNGLEIVRATA